MNAEACASRCKIDRSRRPPQGAEVQNKGYNNERVAIIAELHSTPGARKSNNEEKIIATTWPRPSSKQSPLRATSLGPGGPSRRMRRKATVPATQLRGRVPAAVVRMRALLIKKACVSRCKIDGHRRPPSGPSFKTRATRKKRAAMMKSAPRQRRGTANNEDTKTFATRSPRPCSQQRPGKVHAEGWDHWKLG